jgi:hypothetical protein
LRLLLLSWREGRRRPLSLGLLCCLAVSGSLLVALGSGVADHLSLLLEERLRSTDGNAIIIDILPAAPAQTMAGISFERPVIGVEDVTWLQTLPGVVGSRVLHAVPVPATVFVQVPGLLDSNQFLALYGIAAEDMPEEVRPLWEAADPDGVVPAVMHPDVMTYYNLGMADRYGLPRLDKTVLQDRTFGLLVGRDIFRSLEGAFRARINLCGYDGIVNPWGVALPKTVTDAYLQRLFPHGVPAEAAPVQVRLHLESADRIDDLRRQIDERGLSLAETDPLASMISGISAVGRRLVQIIALVLLLIVGGACASLAAGLVSERRRQIALYRLSGAGLFHLLVIFSAALTATLVLSAAIGVGAAGFLLPRLVAPLATLLQGASDIPATLSPGIWLQAILAALVCGLAATAPPLLVLVRMPLLALLRQG